MEKVFLKNSFLWEKLNQRDLTTGVFTVPTVSKAITVDGFSVAATGGGRFDGKLSEDDVHPRTLYKKISHINADLGLRLGFGAYLPDTLEELNDFINLHLEQYFEALELCLIECPVDCLIAGTRFINEMSYKFSGFSSTVPSSDFEIRLAEYLKIWSNSFDQKLDNFINLVSPDELLIVSDHGIVPAKLDVNLNTLLGSVSRSPITLKDRLRPLYYWFRKRFLVQKVPLLPIKFNLIDSEFFSIGFTSVVYYNNIDRQVSMDDLEEKVSTLNDGLNEKLTMHSYLLKCFDKIPIDKTSLQNDFVPVLNLEFLDGVLCSGRYSDIAHEVKYDVAQMFKDGMYGEVTGCKSNDTLVIYSGKTASEIRHLPDVYKFILDNLS